jgi:hypothetical protein
LFNIGIDPDKTRQEFIGPGVFNGQPAVQFARFCKLFSIGGT